ncbi:MAG: hypothetical protein WC519_01785 [Parcubacteria group bacterium]|jgi:hypothetical protein
MCNSKSPIWLTPIIKLDEFLGDWNAYNNHLFTIFKKDFMDSQPMFHNKPVFLGDQRILNGKPECFWHVTSEKDKQTGERVPNLRRCERIAWIRPIIDHANDPEVWEWPKQHEREIRYNLFLEKEDFLVVLVERKNFYLVTAIYIDYPHNKKRLKNEYQEYDEKTKPAR